MGLHFMNDVYQSNATNPALMSKHRIVVSLPGFYGNLYHSAFSFNDAFTETSDGYSLNLTDVIANLEDENFLQTNFHTDIIGGVVRLNDFQVGATLGLRTSGFAKYTRETMDMFWNGNAGYVGQTVNLAPDFQFSAYSELGISGAYNWQDKVSFGAKVKYLIGISDLSTTDRDNRLDIYTDNEIYQTTFNTDYSINYSGFPALDSSISELADGGIDVYNLENMFPGNSGFAIDLGVSANITDRLSVAASVVDLGSIKWSSNVGSYGSNGSYTYNGLDLFGYVDGDTLNTGELRNDFDEVIDTFTQIIDVQSLNTDSYSTKLPLKIYLSGQYDLGKLTAGVLLYNESFRGKNTLGMALSARKVFGRNYSIGGIYSIRNNRFDNLGINAAAKFGPIQLYMASDNIIPVFQPLNSQNVNFRAGINVAIFSKKEKQEGIIGID